MEGVSGGTAWGDQLGNGLPRRLNGRKHGLQLRHVRVGAHHLVHEARQRDADTIALLPEHEVTAGRPSCRLPEQVFQGTMYPANRPPSNAR